MNFPNLTKVALLATIPFCLSACGSDPSKTAVDLILKGNPQITGTDITLDGCELKITSPSQQGQSQLSSQALLRADLRLFDVRQVRIRPLDDGRAVLTLKRQPVSKLMVDQAMRIVQSMPQGVPSKAGRLTRLPFDGTATIVEERLATENIAGISRKTLRKLLSNPDVMFSLRYTTVMVNGVPQTSEEDGASFYEFAKRVEAISAPMTVSIGLLFNGETLGPESFASGTVALPNKLTFATSSMDDAKQLTKALYEHRKATCSSV